jgi:hypothetical protein
MADKFLPPLIDFIQEKFSHEGNVFYLYGDESVYGFLKDRGVFFLGKKLITPAIFSSYQKCIALIKSYYMDYLVQKL